MLDKRIPYYDIMMYADKGIATCHTIPTLPEGYTYKMYQAGDEEHWAELEYSVDEFPSKEEAILYFHHTFAPYQELLTKRMCFIMSPSGTFVATATAWNGDTYPRLHWVCTKPSEQGKGLGKAIVIYALHKFKDTDTGTIVLHTQTWSYKAIGLYGTLGFKISNTPLLGQQTAPQAYEILKAVMKPDLYDLVQPFGGTTMTAKNNPIGIFDSGLGGISVLNECSQLLPHEHFIYYGDSAFAPYGVKDSQTVINRCIYICDLLIKQHVKAIVIACNTATSVAVDTLRERYSIPIIGMEPALKVAANKKEKQTILVMATTLTLKEKKFANLMRRYEQNHTIIKMPCPLFVSIIEDNLPDRQALVDKQLNEYKNILKDLTIDSIVLGCTHFVFLKDEIAHYFHHQVTLIDGNAGTANHLKDILEKQSLLSDSIGTIEILNSDMLKIEQSKELVSTK